MRDQLGRDLFSVPARRSRWGSLGEIIIELAGFGATHVLMPRTSNDPLDVAQEIEIAVMTESDESDDWKDGSLWFKKWAEEHPLLDDDDDDGAE